MLTSIIHKPANAGEINGRALLLGYHPGSHSFHYHRICHSAFQIIDQATFIHVMGWISRLQQVRALVQFAYFSANPNKTHHDFNCSGYLYRRCRDSSLTENYVSSDFRSAARLVQDNLSMLISFILPATIGAVLVRNLCIPFSMVSQTA